MIQTETDEVHLNISSSLYDGQDVVDGSLPFAVTVRSCSDKGETRKCSDCGGALLDGSQYVLTDLSCVDDNVDVSVLVNGERAKVRRIITNEAAGVALLKLKDTNQVTGICYPPAGFCVDDKPATCIALDAKANKQQIIEPLSDRVCHRNQFIIIFLILTLNTSTLLVILTFFIFSHTLYECAVFNTHWCALCPKKQQNLDLRESVRVHNYDEELFSMKKQELRLVLFYLGCRLSALIK